MAEKLKTKRTSITTIGAKIQAFDIFQTPLSSHYPLPLTQKFFKLAIPGFPYNLLSVSCSDTGFKKKKKNLVHVLA
jgi:hypothetical protein